MILATADAQLTLDSYNHVNFSSEADIPVYQPLWSQGSSVAVQWLIITQTKAYMGGLNIPELCIRKCQVIINNNNCIYDDNYFLL